MKSLCAVLKVYGIKINDCEDNASDEFKSGHCFCIYNARVAQWRSIAFPRRGPRVRIPSRAYLYEAP